MPTQNSTWSMPLSGQEVGGLGVGVRVGPGAGLVGGAARDGLRHRGSPAACGAARRRGREPRPAGGRATMLRLACHTGAMTSDDARAHRPAARAAPMPSSAPRVRPAGRGRSPSGSTTGPRRRGDRARSSPTSRRCCRTGSARWNASWTAPDRRRSRSGGPRTTGPAGDHRTRPDAAAAGAVRPRRGGIERWAERWPTLTMPSARGSASTHGSAR